MVLGTGVSAPILHEEPLRTSFMTRSFGSHLLNLIRLCAIIIIPIVVAFHTSQMWLKTSLFVVEDPTATFTGRYVLRATDSVGNEYFHTSSDAVLSQLENDPRNAAPLVTSMQNDINGDGKADEFIFTIALGSRISSTVPIVKVDFLPAFEYEFYASNEVDLFHKMNSAPLVSVVVAPATASNSANSVYTVDGALAFKQVFPLDAYYVTSYATHYLPTLLNDDEIASISDLRKIDQLAQRYAMRNESLSFEVKGSSVVSASGGESSAVAGEILGGGSGGVDPAVSTLLAASALAAPNVGNGLMVVQVKMRVVPAIVVYKPSPAEVAKWAWIQWFCIGYPVYWVICQFVGILVRGAFVKTTAVFQGRVQPF